MNGRPVHHATSADLRVWSVAGPAHDPVADGASGPGTDAGTEGATRDLAPGASAADGPRALRLGDARWTDGQYPWRGAGPRPPSGATDAANCPATGAPDDRRSHQAHQSRWARGCARGGSLSELHRQPEGGGEIGR